MSADRFSVTHLFAGIAVADYESAIAWYERLVGRPPDVIVTETEAMWQVAKSGWVYVVGDSSRAGRALLAVMVDDLEKWIAGLAERGIPAGTMGTAPGVRSMVITDPEGNRITFFENLDADERRS